MMVGPRPAAMGCGNSESLAVGTVGGQRRKLLTVRNAPVDDVDDPVAARRQIGIMGHDQEAGAVVMVDPAQHVENRVGGTRIEVAGRLVGQHQVWPHGKRAGDRDALRLAA